MHQIIVMVGLPGSGKTWRAHDLAAQKGFQIISSDEIRAEIGGVYNPNWNEKVWEEVYHRVEWNLSIEKSVIIDATNLTRKGRRRVFDIVKKYPGEVQAYVMSTSIEESIRRDSERVCPVGHSVIEGYAKIFEFPQKFEGFQKITIDGYEDVPQYSPEDALLLWKSIKGYQQNNHWHTLTLDDHCLKVANQYSIGSLSWQAGLWHDIGKPECQQIKEGSSEWCFYGHANYGVMKLLPQLQVLNVHSWDALFDILFLIGDHMKPFEDASEKTINKYRALVGDSHFNDIMNFHKADRIATGVINE